MARYRILTSWIQWIRWIIQNKAEESRRLTRRQERAHLSSKPINQDATPSVQEPRVLNLASLLQHPWNKTSTPNWWMKVGRRANPSRLPHLDTPKLAQCLEAQSSFRRGSVHCRKHVGSVPLLWEWRCKNCEVTIEHWACSAEVLAQSFLQDRRGIGNCQYVFASLRTSFSAILVHCAPCSSDSRIERCSQGRGRRAHSLLSGYKCWFVISLLSSECGLALLSGCNCFFGLSQAEKQSSLWNEKRWED